MYRIVRARGAILNEVGQACCRATPACNQSADCTDETRTPTSRCLPSTHPGGGVGGGLLTELREEEEEEEAECLFRIVHARGAIPNEMEPI